MSCAEEQEVIVKESLLAFLQANIPQAKLSHIDEIVLSYVVSILEELGSEWGQEDLFDVESFSEMLTAYFPDFESIPHTNVCDWIFKLSAELSKTTKDSKDFKMSLEEGLKFAMPVVTKCENQLSRVSESSDVSTSGESSHSSTLDFDKSEDTRLLIEMFPFISLTEATHCLSLSNGSVDEAVQLVLHRQEIGQTFSNSENSCLLQHKSRPVNEKTLKKKIIEKYSYIDQDDDQREHRPPPLKEQPKKMVRYLDNKVVTIKGERYTEIKEDPEAKEEAKKTYVSLKPARQYRFH
nr:EOG090X0A55 [Polyphemus pediculus]